MRILIVVPSQSRVTGNWVSAQRFQAGLEERGHRVRVIDTPLQPKPLFRETLIDFAPDISLLLHAYRSGKPWLEATCSLPLPFVVLLTGTDVNHGLDDPEQASVIRTILQQARVVLYQNPMLAATLSANHPEWTHKLQELPPGITLGNQPYNLRQKHNLAADKVLFLCPAGLRPVKGLVELLAMFDLVAAESQSFQLAFCGPILDESYANSFTQAVQQRPWACYLGTIPAPAMASAIQSADVILNNSVSEGLSNALLEAAVLGVPILARNIPGNATVVQHGSNGRLFNDAQEFCRDALQFINDPDLRRNLSQPDRTSYDPIHEAAALEKILQQALIKS